MSIAPITAGSPLAAATVAGVSESGRSPAGGAQAFSALVDHLVAGQAQANAAADKAIQGVVAGQADSLHTVGLAVAEADLSFRLILEVRNRISEAYQDVMRMQV